MNTSYVKNRWMAVIPDRISAGGGNGILSSLAGSEGKPPVIGGGGGGGGCHNQGNQMSTSMNNVSIN